MTHCREQLAFSFHHSTTVVADFKGGLITSDAGLLPLRELDDRLGWTAGIAPCLSDPRDPAKTTHILPTLLRQRLFGLIAGYKVEIILRLDAGFAAPWPRGSIGDSW